MLLNGGTAFNKILKNKNLDAFTINTFDTDIVILTNNCGVTELLNDFGVSLLNVKMTSDVKRQLFRYYIESYEQDSEPTQDHIEPVSLSVQAPYIDITIKTWDPILEYLKDENKSGDLINTFSNSDFVVVYLMLFCSQHVELRYAVCTAAPVSMSVAILCDASVASNVMPGLPDN